MEPRSATRPTTSSASLEMIGDAASRGAKLVSPAGAVQYRLRLRDARGSVRGWPRRCPRADHRGLAGGRPPSTADVIVAGITERDGAMLYNSAVDRRARRLSSARYRKNHLWGAENLFFEPGNLGVPVFHTGSAASRAPSATTSGSPRPSGWPRCRARTSSAYRPTGCRCPSSRRNLPVMANILAMGGAHSNSMFVAAADRVGHRARSALPGQQPHRAATPAGRSRGRRARIARRCCCRGEPLGRAPQAQLERLQSAPARPAHRRLRRDARRRRQARLVLRARERVSRASTGRRRR